MYQNGESPNSDGVGEHKTDKIDPESKKKSSWPEKVTLPSIQPTVIQALPSDQQILPSLQPAEKLTLPKIQSKERKAPPRPSSAVKRILPSIPTVGELSLPSIEVNTATSMAHMLSVLPTIEEKPKPSAPKPEVKGRPTVKSTVRRMLPEIPPLDDLTLPSIEPTVVIVRPKIRSRRRRLLPILPTIIEQTSEEDATEEGVHSAINGASQSPEAREKDSSSSSAPSVAEQAQISLQSTKETLPCGTEKLQNVKPKKKASKKGSRRPRKLSKATQTIFQSAEEELMPSLKPIKDKPPENPETTVEYPLQPAPTATSSGENQPRQSGTLSVVQAERGREQSVKEAMPGVKQPAREFSSSPPPTLEHALPRPPITRRTKKTRPESVPPLNLDQLCPKSPPVRRMKLSPQAPEPPRNVKGATRQTQTKADAKRLVPPLNLEYISPKPPTARQMKLGPHTTDVEPLGNVQGAPRQTQKAKWSVPPLNLEHVSPKPPAARQMKLSPQAADVETLGKVQRAARQTQVKAETKRLVPPLNLDKVSPKPPPARRMKLNPQTTGEQLGNIQKTARQTQMKAERLFRPQQTLEHKIPKPAAARRAKLSSQTTTETSGSAQGTKSQTKSLLSPQYTPQHNFPGSAATRPSKVSPQATKGEPLKYVPGTLPETLTKSEMLLNPQHTQDHNLPRPSAAGPTKADLPVTDLEVPCVPSRKKETPPNEQPKPGTYAFMNLKRREFQALQRLQLMAKQCQANGQPVGKGSQPRNLLTVKSALPGIQSTKEEETLLKPHPPATNFTKKGLTSARPAVKRPRPNIRPPFDPPLTNLQPNVKQVLPSISSSSLDTLVKQPLPSVQPDEKSNLQPTVEETDQSSQSGHLPGLERQ